ncbi:hypothetical protein TcCL_NonESM07151 [Trypanosoma cruzi]|nr:hypothetical protein TcCL_NonESM07151 [Trypanosoma cruzi]
MGTSNRFSPQPLGTPQCGVTAIASSCYAVCRLTANVASNAAEFPSHGRLHNTPSLERNAVQSSLLPPPLLQQPQNTALLQIRLVKCKLNRLVCVCVCVSAVGFSLMALAELAPAVIGGGGCNECVQNRHERQFHQHHRAREGKKAHPSTDIDANMASLSLVPF